MSLTAEDIEFVYTLDVDGFNITVKRGDIEVAVKDARCTYTGRPRPLSLTVYPHAYYDTGFRSWKCHEDIVEAIFVACQMLVDHELREGFKIKADKNKVIRPYDPHGKGYSLQRRTNKAFDFFRRDRKAVLHRPTLSPEKEMEGGV